MKTIIFFITVLISMNLYSQEFDYFPTSTTNQIIKHSYYTLSYSEQHEQAEWVAYELTKSRVYGEVSRTDNFREDPLVITGSATLSDYKGSGYDRGHIALRANSRGIHYEKNILSKHHINILLSTIYLFP